MIYRCDLYPQYKKYKAGIDQTIKRVLNSGVYIFGKELTRFEEEFAKYIGVKYAVGVASGTDALILSLKALGIGNGDEVITTAYTAIPTVSAIIATGAKPVFVDINPSTYLIDIEKIPGAITSKTRAIIPVHIFGNVVDVRSIKKQLPKTIKIIEDACQAHGSQFNGKKAGSFGDLAAFSFYPTKNLGGYGDGGMVVTNSNLLYKKLKLLRMYGMINKDEIVLNSINSRLDEIQAAVLATKLKYLDSDNKIRNKIAEIYMQNIKSKLIDFQVIPEGVLSNYHLFVVRLKKDREKIVKFLSQKGIQTNIYYNLPIHLQKPNSYLGFRKGDLPETERLCREALAIPFYPEIASASIKRVIWAINSWK